jgi:hypothetical protein
MNRLLLCFLLLLAPTVSAEIIRFDDTPPGTLPAGWLGTKTGTGAPKWSVEKEPSAPSGGQVLLQSGEATFPVCLRTDANLQDGFVEIKFKPVSGKEDQAGGVVWRARDADNYYVARGNALEDNVSIYHVVAGQRIQFDSASVKVAGGQWHALRVEFHGPDFRVFFDDQEVLSAKDDAFTAAGLVGVWTKADSVTAFDDFAWGPLPVPSP